MSKFQRLLWSLPALAQLMLSPAPVSAEEPTAAAASAEAEVRQAIRDYDEALRRADVAAVEKVWASEYTFVNPRGERVTRADRVANLRDWRAVPPGRREQIAQRLDTTLDERLQLWQEDLDELTRFDPELPYLAEIEIDLRALVADRNGAGAAT